MTDEGFELRETTEAEEDEESIKEKGKYSLAINLALIIAALCSILFAKGILRLALLAVLIIIFMASKIRLSSKPGE